MIINVLGAGAFGTALAIAFSKNHKVNLITLPEYVDELKKGENKTFFPGFVLSPSISISTEFSMDGEIVFVATPAQEIVHAVKRLEQNVLPHIPIVFCSKGLYMDDQGHAFLMTEYAKTKLKNPLYILGGPNFAHELAQYKMSFANVAGPKASVLCEQLFQDHFILEPWHDILGVQLVGFYKNVVAIACGYYEGLGKGLNERAALFTQAFDEMVIFGKAFWEKDFDEKTLMTYAGIGDLVLTCTSMNSRNYKLGLTLGQKPQMTFDEYKKQNIAVAEGAYTVLSIHKMKGDLKLSICEMVYERLYDTVLSRATAT